MPYAANLEQRERWRRELVEMRDRGLTQSQAALKLGITKGGVSRRVRTCGIPWRRADVTIVHVDLDHRGTHQAYTIPELAAATGIGYDTLYKRYHFYGYRGRQLLAPAHQNRRKMKRIYELGLTTTDWKAVLEIVDECQAIDGCSRLRAIKRAVNRTGLPHGAIGAADRGEWERLN